MPAITDFEASKIEDLKNDKISPVIYWTIDEVCDFFEVQLKLPEYKQTLRSNGINGRRLIYLDASHLPKLGIIDYKHIMLITKTVREILNINSPYWNRSISLPPKESMDLYLEAKSVNGKESDKLNYTKFEENTKDAKWQPPQTNQGFILPNY